MLRCACYIIPNDVLERFAADKTLDPQTRQAAADSARVSAAVRRVRTETQALTAISKAMGAHLLQAPARAPKIVVDDCRHTQTLPGAAVPGAGKAKDATAKRTYAQTTALAKFYKEAFGRNSIDDAGVQLLSSIHYGTRYNNAMWNGQEMLYGDGDGKLFTDFTKGTDVIGHELTHGVTQYTLQLDYSGDAGGLNESISDCFGSMFRQWQNNETADKADWLIGPDIVGPVAKAKGYTCLRNMAKPDDKAALARQPAHYSQLTPGMDPHYTSGPPNLAFALACKAVGGKSWEKVGKVWYSVLTTSGAMPAMTMKQFAAKTRQVAAGMFAKEKAVAGAVDMGWGRVGL